MVTSFLKPFKRLYCKPLPSGQPRRCSPLHPFPLSYPIHFPLPRPKFFLRSSADCTLVDYPRVLGRGVSKRSKGMKGDPFTRGIEQNARMDPAVKPGKDTTRFNLPAFPRNYPIGCRVTVRGRFSSLKGKQCACRERERNLPTAYRTSLRIPRRSVGPDQ